MFDVYLEMLFQVMLDYQGIGDFRELTLNEIETLYDGLRSGLRKTTAKNGA